MDGDDLLPEVLKGLKEYFEWRNAPQEAAKLLLAFGGRDSERVRYKGYAQYINAQQRLDTSKGVILLTDSRFAYLAKKRFIPFLRVTEHLLIPLAEIETVDITRKHKLASPCLELLANGRKHLFLMTNLSTFASLEQGKDLAELIKAARGRAS